MGRHEGPLVFIGRLRWPPEVQQICADVGARMEATDGTRMVCDVSAVTHPDCRTVDGLARLRLTARRLGCELELRDVSDELHGLLDIAGLCKVVGCGREPDGD